MIETSDKSGPVYPAATVVLLRDGKAGLEVLLVQRSNALRHMAGMWVFPGGRIDPSDYRDAGDDYSAALNAAIRETDEETGVQIDASQLLYFSHWTTPKGAKKRFATWFFLALLEDDQRIQVDGSEISDYRWVAPRQALADVANSEHPLRLMPPTYISMLEVLEYANCAAVRQGMNGKQVLEFAPLMHKTERGFCFLYNGDAGYDADDPEAKGIRHRAYLIDDQLQYICEL